MQVLNGFQRSFALLIVFALVQLAPARMLPCGAGGSSIIASGREQSQASRQGGSAGSAVATLSVAPYCFPPDIALSTQSRRWAK